MILVLAVALTAAAPVAPAPAPPAAAAVVEAKPKVLVLDFRDDGVGENAVRIIRDTLVAHVSQDDRLEVISSEDMRRALDVDAQKRAVGACSDEGCLAEIAGALGAELTLYGTAGKLGDLVVVNVSLFDARASKSVGRETVEVKSLEQLPPALRAAGDKLIAKLPRLAHKEVNSEPGLSVLGWSGIGALGVGLVGGAVFGVVAAANNPSPTDGRTFPEKQSAVGTRNVSTGLAMAGGALAAAGAGLLLVGLD